MNGKHQHAQLVAVLSEISRTGIDEKHVPEVAEILDLRLTGSEMNYLYADLAPASERNLSAGELDLFAQGIEYRWAAAGPMGQAA